MDFHSNPDTLPAELWEKYGAFANTQKDEQGPAGI